MREYELTVNGRTHRVAMRRFSLEAAELEVDGAVFTVAIEPLLGADAPRPTLPAPRVVPGAPGAPPAPAAPAGAAGSISAPIPGQVMEIFVTEGGRVSAGEPVLKMEAMKMENLIHAHLSGRVVAVRVKPGDAVAQGQELVVIG